MLFKNKVERVDRFKNIIIVYPKYMIPFKSDFKRYWDLLILLILLWILLYIPWEIAQPEDTIPGIDFFIFMVFLLDFIFSFRISFYNKDQDEIIDDR